MVSEYKKGIVFLPYKSHQEYAIYSLAKKLRVTVMLPPEKTLSANSKINKVDIEYKQFGANFLKKIFKTEARTLKFVKNLTKKLNGLEIKILITYELYHWYTFQCIKYKKQNPEIKLFITSEMQRWPKNPVANILKRILLSFLKLQIKYINGIIVYTNAGYKFTKNIFPNANVILLPTPIDTVSFKPDENRTFLKNGELSLLMNARFSPYKRYDDLFNAVSILKKEGKKIKLTCISRYEHDKKSITDLIKEKRLEENINVINSVNSKKEMADLYKLYDVLVLPSRNEAIGLVVPEAMACGTPTITSDTVGANVYVKNKETGLIFKTRNVNELVECIRSCFNSDILEKYSKSGIKHINDNFTLKNYADKFSEEISK